eukprot:TRINITY_DN1913_c2_g1_i2.p2 TRINITY_DN1913_c2_g1~~TRINITY_DN1913_c2_g1_i2.p2  ORF type:complete len:166 (+),score=80.87 TRINITY_DN1913_c2_g1_i2:240-737(+)
MCLSKATKQVSVPELVDVVGQLLQSVSEGQASENVGVYDGQKAPEISMRDYLQRWLTHTKCDKEVLVIAVVYIDKICTNTELSLTKTNVHRIVLGALVIATKWHQDRVHSNHYYAAIGGVQRAELARLERCVLNDLQFETHVTPSLFAKYMKRFNQHIAKNAVEN